MIAPGDVLHNRYRIERSIGRGGMGEVFAAVVLLPPPGREREEEVTLLQPTPQSSRVAIKVVSRAILNEAAMARLQREAVAASRIKSDFVPELVEVGTTPEGELFLAMDILYGDTLAERLKGKQCLPWDEVFLLGDDVLSGLIDAHEAGVIHRDLKPSNIFLCEPERAGAPERAKVLDFGVCKLDTHDEEKLTGTGESVGTVAYMAPEQIRGASQVTAQADLYSFATVVFEVLSARLPHAAAGQMALLASKLERNATRLADVAQVPVPAGLDAFLARLLARDPAERWATAREVRDAWRMLGLAVVEPRSTAGLPAVENASPATEAGLASGSVEVPSPRPSRIGIVVAGFAVALSLVVLLVMAATRHDPKAADVVAVDLPPPEIPIPRAAADSLPVAPVAAVVPVAPEDRSAASNASAPEATAVEAGFPASDASAAAPRQAASARPPFVPWRAPAHPRPPGATRPGAASTTTKPHITDKPRY